LRLSSLPYCIQDAKKTGHGCLPGSLDFVDAY
jgi:hypothetical protein